MHMFTGTHIHTCACAHTHTHTHTHTQDSCAVSLGCWSVCPGPVSEYSLNVQVLTTASVLVSLLTAQWWYRSQVCLVLLYWFPCRMGYLYMYLVTVPFNAPLRTSPLSRTRARRRADLKPMNINHLDSRIYHVLYFGVLNRSSFGGVRAYVRTHTYIQSQLVTLIRSY
jgi:hypothetical protein